MSGQVVHLRDFRPRPVALPKHVPVFHQPVRARKPASFFVIEGVILAVIGAWVVSIIVLVTS